MIKQSTKIKKLISSILISEYVESSVSEEEEEEEEKEETQESSKDEFMLNGRVFRKATDFTS